MKYIFCILSIALGVWSLPAAAQAELREGLEKPSWLYEYCMENASTLEEQKVCAERELVYQGQILDFAYQHKLSGFEDLRAVLSPERLERFQAHKEEFIATHQLWLTFCDSQMKFYNSLSTLPGHEVMGLIWKVHAMARRAEYLFQGFELSQLPGHTQLAARP